MEVETTNRDPVLGSMRDRLQWEMRAQQQHAPTTPAAAGGSWGGAIERIRATCAADLALGGALAAGVAVFALLVVVRPPFVYSPARAGTLDAPKFSMRRVAVWAALSATVVLLWPKLWPRLRGAVSTASA